MTWLMPELTALWLMCAPFTHYGILKTLLLTTKCGLLMFFGTNVPEVVQWGWGCSSRLHAMDKLTDNGTTS